MHFGTDAQKRRFLPGILRGTEIWCQGYSEPDAGSDLANVQTRAELDGDEWVINGQKVWTSLAHWAQWIFVIARTDRDAPKHKGLSYLLVPMDQPGRIEIRPDRADHRAQRVQRDVLRRRAHRRRERRRRGRTAAGGSRWERSRSSGARPTLGQQLSFESELVTITDLARANGLATDPVFRQRLADAWITLRVMRFHALRTLPMLEHGTVDPATSIHKLFWASFHRGLGELAVDVLGAHAVAADRGDDRLTRLFLYSPRRHDLRRLEPDPTQRDRRAGAGLAEGATMTNTPVPPDLPARPRPARGQDRARHRRGRDRHRVRDREALPSKKGARVVVSDIHERRLARVGSTSSARTRTRCSATSPSRTTCSDSSPKRSSSAAASSTCS